MLYDVTIKEEPDELVASIRTRIRPERIGDVIPDAFERLMGCVGPVGYGNGMPGIVMHEMREPEVADIEVFMPVADRFDPPEGVEVTTLRGGTMAATVHTGPYDASGAAYEALNEWIDEHGRQIVGPPREHYLNDPHVVGMDRAETEIEVPLA
ncbi:MAG TPA: GyrI-like domain-containing protein [Actinomycetota bacterium]|nr:GyrI-like domain-containing protein [Actinomycetota bacterium]